MKRSFNIIHKIGLLIGVFSILISCGEKDIVIKEYTREPGDFALVRFYNFSINAPTVNFYANNVKVTAVQSLTGEMAPTGVSYGGTYPTNGYVEVPFGSNITLSSRTPTTLTIPTNNVNKYERDKQVTSLQIPSLYNKKSYSLYMVGLFNPNTHSAESFLVADELPPSDTSKAFIRFINSGLEEVGDLVVIAKYREEGVEKEITLSESLAFKTSTSFIPLPYGSYTLEVSPKNNPTRIITRSIAFNRDRVHTLAIRGDIRVTSPAPFIDNTQNR